jgi:hypothetical protein
MPAKSTANSVQRAIRARAAVIAYRKAADTNETREGALLGDLLTDLMHLSATCKGVSFQRSLDVARANFTADKIQELCARAETIRA